MKMNIVWFLYKKCVNRITCKCHKTSFAFCKTDASKQTAVVKETLVL